MALWYLTATNSTNTDSGDLNKVLDLLVGAPSTDVQCSIAKGATEESYGYTAPGVPGKVEFATAAATVKINVAAVQNATDIHMNVRLDRIDSAGAVQESSATSTEQDIVAAGTYTYSIASKDWTAGASTDRLRLALIIRNSKTSAARSVNISVSNANSYVDTAIGIAHVLGMTACDSVTTTTINASQRHATTMAACDSVTTTTFGAGKTAALAFTVDALSAVTDLLGLRVPVATEVNSVSVSTFGATIAAALEWTCAALSSITDLSLSTAAGETEIECEVNAVSATEIDLTKVGAATLVLTAVQHETHIDLSWVAA